MALIHFEEIHGYRDWKSSMGSEVELVGGNPGVAGYGCRKDGFELVVLDLDANFLPFPFPRLSPSKAVRNKIAGTCCFIFHSRN